MRPNLFSLRLMMLAFLATATVSSAAVACPDLSGTYQYPGVEGLAAVCEKSWEGREDLPLPGPGGFYLSAFEANPFVIEQKGCETLVIHTRVGWEYPPRTAGQSEEKAIVLDLRKGARRKVEWGEDSLFIQQKFVPEGFRLPFSRNVWELRLKKLEGGGLEYYLRHLERGRVEGEVRCRLGGAKSSGSGRRCFPHFPWKDRHDDSSLAAVITVRREVYTQPGPELSGTKCPIAEVPESLEIQFHELLIRGQAHGNKKPLSQSVMQSLYYNPVCCQSRPNVARRLEFACEDNHCNIGVKILQIAKYGQIRL